MNRNSDEKASKRTRITTVYESDGDWRQVARELEYQYQLHTDGSRRETKKIKEVVKDTEKSMMNIVSTW